MRYRKLSSTGDYIFGQGVANFYVNSAACVAQSVETRLRLWTGEWFLDNREGTPWLQQILGKGTAAIYDMAIRTRVLQTQGVTAITAYQSSYDATSRALSVTMRISTIFGEAPVEVVL